MERLTAALAAAMLVTAGLPAAAAVTGQTAGEEARPGAQFAGAVGVQGAEVRGEVEGRTLEERLEAADSNASRASVVAGESERAGERLADLRERRSTLRERYENGSVSESEYRARLAGIAAESRTLERRLNRTSDAARSLPPEVARERGVNASEVETLRAGADALTDDEAADAARGVAGGGAGDGLGGPPEDHSGPDDRGPPGDRGDDGTGTDDRGNGTGTAGPPDDHDTDGDVGESVRNGTVDGGLPNGTAGDGVPDDRGAAGNATDRVDDGTGDRENGTDADALGDASDAGEDLRDGASDASPGGNSGPAGDEVRNSTDPADDDAGDGEDDADSTATPTPSEG